MERRKPKQEFRGADCNLRSPSKNDSPYAGRQNSLRCLTTVAAAVLVFTLYVTFETFTLKLPSRQSTGERWLASLPDPSASRSALAVTEREPDSGQELKLFARREGPKPSTSKRNGGGYPYSMAAPQPVVPVPDYLAFIGVFSSINGAKRRSIVRETWFPSTKSDLEKFEEEKNVKLRFVVGKPKSGQLPDSVKAEEDTYGEFLHIDVIEEYDNLKLKILKYLRDTLSIHRAEYYIKVDDDIYFRPDRVPLAVPQWKGDKKGFLGCFRKGSKMFDKPNDRYFEPQRFLMHQEKYFMYTAGPAFALSYRGALLLGSVPPGGLRFYGAGDASVGGWMLALNVTHGEDHRLCHNACKHNTIAYYDTTKCNGLCDSAKELPQLHKEQCGAEPTVPTGHADLPTDPVNEADKAREQCAKIYEDRLDQSECRRPLRR
uniref:Hexosyltransferase n=1 Tax=Tetraselmis sp. GSL018 TaxID=582737 RepID=A0A061SA09_9CHLO